ncbi:amino acid adenylation domain-containing protein, partial [Paenibacillus sp. LMG 31461]
MSNRVIGTNLTARSQDLDERAYLQNSLVGSQSFNGFPYDYNGRAKSEYLEAEFSIPVTILQDITSGDGGVECGIEAVLLTGVYYMIYRYSQSEDIMIGIPSFSYSKNSKQNDYYIIIRNKLNGMMVYSDLLSKINQSFRNAQENKNPNYQWSNSTDAGNKPPTDVIVSYNSPISIERLENHHFNMAFCFEMRESMTHCVLKYNANLYKESTIKNLTKNLVQFYHNASISVNESLHDINILSDSDIKQLLGWGTGKVSLTSEDTIQGLFQNQVKKYPDRTAIVYENSMLTYQELDDMSSRFAAMLMDQGVQVNDTVAVMMKRTHSMVVIYLGILKAGAVCLPIDIYYPEERIQFMIKDSGAKIIVSNDEQVSRKAYGQKVIYYVEEEVNQYRLSRIIHFNANNPAYIIYTSGSEGNPKGVILNHKGIINHTWTKIDLLDFNVNDVICHNINLSFVASIWIVYAPLFVGAKLVIYDETNMKDIALLFNTLDKDGITIMEIVPSALNTYLELLQIGKNKVKLSKLKSLIITGERVSPELVNLFYKEYNVELVNAYGQSECSDDTLHYKIPYNTQSISVPIGNPSYNTNVYILNDQLKLQPVGVRGELYISGVGITEGYLNRSDLTLQKYIANPFIPGTRMFRTGDFAKWGEDGNVQYLGRVDQQVKIRGFRVELEEIESQLMKHPKINRAIVIKRENASLVPYICAYLIGNDVTTDELRTDLEQVLPHYMIPSFIVALDTFPLLPNGKINKKELPDPKVIKENSNDIVYSALSDIEYRLSIIWCQLLNIQNIDPLDNFFSMGGSSFSATKLVMFLYKEFGQDVTLKDIVSNPTIRQLGQLLESREQANYKP